MCSQREHGLGGGPVLQVEEGAGPALDRCCAGAGRRRFSAEQGQVRCCEWPSRVFPLTKIPIT